MNGLTMQGKEKREILVVGALGAILSFAVLYYPTLILLLPLMPLPYIYVLKKYGHRAGTMAVVLTAVINASYTGILGLVVSLATFGLVAVSVGGAFRENLKPAWTVLISIGSSVVGVLILYYVGMRFGALAEMREILQQTMPWERLTNMGFSVQDKRELVNLYLAVLPGFLTGAGLVVGLVCYYIYAGFLRWRRFPVERLKPMKEWAFPKWIAFAYILIDFLPKDIFILNLQFALMAILMLEGIVLITFLLERWRIHRGLRYAALALIIPVFFLFLYLVGIIDAVFPIRKVNRWKFWES